MPSIYELHVKTFHDSNADGYRRFFAGLIEKLDYLQGTRYQAAIWLLPFYPSAP